MFIPGPFQTSSIVVLFPGKKFWNFFPDATRKVRRVNFSGYNVGGNMG